MKLKLIFAVFLTSLFLITSINSQVKLDLGLQGGLNLANISLNPNNNANISGRTAMIFGTFLDIDFGKYIAAETGLNFTMKGFSYTDANNSQNTVKLTYLEIPIIVKGKFPVEKFTPFVMVGALLGMQLSASDDVTPQGGQTQNADVSTIYGGMDFNLFFGGGGAYKVIPKLSIFTQFGYAIGLSNIYKDPNQTGTTVKNNGFRIELGVMFHLL